MGDALEWLWRFFISRKTGLVLILVLGVFSLVGTLLAQTPAEIVGDAQGYASWLESVRPKYGGWTNVFSFLGLFSTFSSVWFKGTLVLLTTSILACSVNRTPVLWRRATRPRTTMHDAFFERATLHGDAAVAGTASEALERAENTLRAHHFRIVPAVGGNSKVAARSAYADQNRWAPFGSIAAHIGFVVVLLGAFLSATTGFKDAQFAAPVGSAVEVGHGSGLTVKALSFSDAYYADGSPKDYASEIVISKNGAAVAQQTIRVNQPLSYGGVSFYQSFFGTAANVVVQDAAGKTLLAKAVPLMWSSDDGKHNIGQFTVPGQQTTVYVVLPASGQVDPAIQAGQAQLEVYQGGSSTATATQVVSQGKPATIAGLNFTFERERQFTGLIVARDPGAIWVWTGSALMVIGIIFVFFFPHRRVWVQVRPGADGGSTIRFASHQLRDAAFEPRFRALVADAEESATPSSTQGK
jgi:cytochrome c biogenesis protein